MCFLARVASLPGSCVSSSVFPSCNGRLTVTLCGLSVCVCVSVSVCVCVRVFSLFFLAQVRRCCLLQHPLSSIPLYRRLQEALPQECIYRGCGRGPRNWSSSSPWWSRSVSDNRVTVTTANIYTGVKIISWETGGAIFVLTQCSTVY